MQVRFAARRRYCATLKEEGIGAYLVRRTALLFVTVLGVSIIIFTLMRVVPGNIADMLYAVVDPRIKYAD